MHGHTNVKYSKYVQRIICNKILKKILVCHLQGKKEPLEDLYGKTAL